VAAGLKSQVTGFSRKIWSIPPSSKEGNVGLALPSSAFCSLAFLKWLSPASGTLPQVLPISNDQYALLMRDSFQDCLYPPTVPSLSTWEFYGSVAPTDFVIWGKSVAYVDIRFFHLKMSFVRT